MLYISFRPISLFHKEWAGKLLYTSLLFCQPAFTAPLALELPIRCSVGQDCFIQNYFDHAPDSTWSDYACGHLSYDGHFGTDFRLPGIQAMRQGVAVLAAADGVVAGLRDGEPDAPVLMRPGDPESGKRAAGNGVRISHGDGWETQYSHMKQGSVTVRVGQKVHAGDQLCLVGLSGNTEFPHLDITVLYNGQAVDPFAPSRKRACTGDNSSSRADTLWKPEVLNRLRYIPTGLLLAGWSSEAPAPDKARNGNYSTLRSNAAALVFWVEVFGVQTADRQTFEIFDPQGKQILTSTSAIPGNKATWFAYAGKPRPAQGWMNGSYRAVYRLERKGAVIVMEIRYIEIAPTQ